MLQRLCASAVFERLLHFLKGELDRKRKMQASLVTTAAQTSTRQQFCPLTRNMAGNLIAVLLSTVS